MARPKLSLPILLSLVGIILAACTRSLPASSREDSPNVTVLAANINVDESSTPLPASPTHAPLPTSTPTNTFAPTITSTLTSTPTPTHPLMIEVMRKQAYPGSQITIEEKLENGANYDRFIISYQSEGNTIYALFTVPWGETPPNGWPVIIFNHGYIPPEQYRTTERYVDYVDVLARNGYIVLRSDYRGHGNSEGEAVSSYQSPGYTADILNAITSVKTYPDADPERIGMWGHSMGGNITLRAMVISDEIKAGVIWGGVVVSYPDMVEHWFPTFGQATPDPNSRRGRWLIEWNEAFGDFEDNPTFWASISANSYLTDLSGPLQLHHGTADESVPHKLSEILYADVAALGLPVELYLYDGDNHNISKNFWAAMQTTVAFFDLHLKE